MKKAYILIACFLFSNFLRSQVMWQFNRDTIITWYYQEGDEFNSTKVNTDYWQYILWARSLYMNHEQQYYTEGGNVVQDNGTVKLVAKREPVFKRTVDYKNDNDSLFANNKFITLNKTHFTFTSGKLTTRSSSLNKGYYECRFKLPSKKGYWPAFWLHGGDPNEEIDIMEARSSRPTQVHVDTHCPNRCDLVWDFLKRKSFGSWIKTRTNFVDKFNVMACEWDDESVKFYLNGEFIAISKVRFDVPKHMVINLAVPSLIGPFGPGPAASDNGDVFEVDYVRVWSKTRDNKQNSASTIYTAVDTSAAPHSTSIIKRKKKFYYGKKKEAKNEGFKITMSRNGNLLQFVVLGRVDNIFPEFSMLDESGKILKQNLLSKSYNTISLENLARGKYIVKILRSGQEAKFPITIE